MGEKKASVPLTEDAAPSLAYYNEFEPFAAEWLGNLIDQGHITNGAIDARSIRDVRGSDLAGFERVHFFAGIGGWERVLELAGWPIGVSVWTGSCPCQPFSDAGKRKGKEDDRHLWPEMFRLVEECRPAIVFGEQVSSQKGLEWLDGVFADLEGIGYACGAADLPAASVAAPHARHRLWWMAVADGAGSFAGSHAATAARYGDTSKPSGRNDSGVEYAESERRGKGRAEPVGRGVESRCGANGLGDPIGEYFRWICGGAPRKETEGDSEGAFDGAVGDGFGSTGSITDGMVHAKHGRSTDKESRSKPWQSGYKIVLRSDGKRCRTSSKPGDEPLAYGIPRGLGSGEPTLRRMVGRARRNRVGRIKAYGNAIVAEVGANFVSSAMETLGIST